MNRSRPACAATLVSLASFILQLAAPPCFAQTAEPPQPAAQQQTVEQLANLAYEQHKEGKYAESISTYLKAYEISKASDIIFNVATIYDRKLHERELAADYYRRYIRTPDPNPELVKRATERLTGLKKETEEEAAKKAAAAPPSAGQAPNGTSAPAARGAEAGPTPEEREASMNASRAWKTAGIIVGATGVAGILASLALGYEAKLNNDNANKVCSGTTCSSQSGVDDANHAGTWATASTITFGVGAALTVTGLAFIFAAPKPLPQEAPPRTSRWSLRCPSARPAGR